MTIDSVSCDDAQKETAKIHNIRAAQTAKEYVESLNLAAKGLGYIEDSCLEELDYYMTIEDAELTSYTVYTPKVNSPKTNAVIRSSPSLSGMVYFGSYNSRDFYVFYPSSGSFRTNYEKQTSSSILQEWIKNIVSCTVQFQDVQASVVWSAFHLAMGTPNNYIVHDEAFTKSYCNLNTYTRGIYTLGGNNTYLLQTSQQYAMVYPYTEFHPVDSPKYNGSYNQDYDPGVAYSPKYRESIYLLCQEAWQVFYGAVSFNKFDKININSLKTFWR